MRSRSIGFVTAVALLALPASDPVHAATQKERWRNAVHTDLRNAATAEETYRIDNATYTLDVRDLKAQGFVSHRRVRLVVKRADSDSYCLQARHENLLRRWHFDSLVGAVERGRCPSDPFTQRVR